MCSRTHCAERRDGRKRKGSPYKIAPCTPQIGGDKNHWILLNFYSDLTFSLFLSCRAPLQFSFSGAGEWIQSGPVFPLVPSPPFLSYNDRVVGHTFSSLWLLLYLLGYGGRRRAWHSQNCWFWSCKDISSSSQTSLWEWGTLSLPFLSFFVICCICKILSSKFPLVACEWLIIDM